MSSVHYIIILIVLVFIGFVLQKHFNRPNPDDYYPPKVDTLPEYFSVSVSAEVDEKGGKKAFVNLFERYGFSGNGPSIEQVIRKNVKLKGVEYDSEGDMFSAYTTSKGQFEELVKSVKCIEEIKCLDDWLNKAKWALLKE